VYPKKLCLFNVICLHFSPQNKLSQVTILPAYLSCTIYYSACDFRQISANLSSNADNYGKCLLLGSGLELIRLIHVEGPTYIVDRHTLMGKSIGALAASI
jgi:hypothetical protein